MASIWCAVLLRDRATWDMVMFPRRLQKISIAHSGVGVRIIKKSVPFNKYLMRSKLFCNLNHPKKEAPRLSLFYDTSMEGFRNTLNKSTGMILDNCCSCPRISCSSINIIFKITINGRGLPTLTRKVVYTVFHLRSHTVFWYKWVSELRSHPQSLCDDVFSRWGDAIENLVVFGFPNLPYNWCSNP